MAARGDATASVSREPQSSVADSNPSIEIRQVERVVLMKTATATLSKRDRAVLRAIAAGRCQVSGGCGMTLLVDGLCCADQFAGARLIGARLIAAPGSAGGPARLTPTAVALLAAPDRSAASQPRSG
jgi:hypothetical protein